MKDIRKQNIGIINNSNAIIINGDVTIDNQVFQDIKNTFFEILRGHFEKYSVIAVKKAKCEIEKCIKCILEKLLKEQQLCLIKKFQSISIQVVLHDALVGYLSVEDEVIKDFIIDTLIDRLKVQNSSSECSIINEAIKIIPNLNTSTSSLIALMNLRHQIVDNFSFMLEVYFHNLAPIVNNACNINNTDIEYLIQSGCTHTINGIYNIESFENHLLKQYDLFFRHKGDKEILDKFKLIHPQIMNKVNNLGTSMFCLNGHEQRYWQFCDVNSSLFYNRLKSRRQEYLIPLIEELKENTPLFTVTELRNYLCNINNNWNNVFSLLNNKKLLKEGLSIVGLYIGSKVISKCLHNSSLSISEISNPISL